jgi:hypothetical protein
MLISHMGLNYGIAKVSNECSMDVLCMIRLEVNGITRSKFACAHF